MTLLKHTILVLAAISAFNCSDDDTAGPSVESSATESSATESSSAVET
jgi:hypothetical protein